MNQETVLITGASGGIGKCFAELFAQKGYRLVLVARSKDKLEEILADLSKRFKVEINIIVQDLSLNDAAFTLFNAIQNKQLQITYLINNAGFGDYGLFDEMSLERANEMMQLNMVCLAQLVQLFSAQMKINRKGKILNVASVAAFQTGPYMALYFATKAFVLSLSDALHEELLPFGISVTALCPGPTETGFVNAANLQSNKFFNQKMPTPMSVASFGLKALERNQAVAIPGIMNKMQVLFLRLTPRVVVRKLTARVLKM